jgi:hypothetical protein
MDKVSDCEPASSGSRWGGGSISTGSCEYVKRSRLIFKTLNVQIKQIDALSLRNYALAISGTDFSEHFGL